MRARFETAAATVCHLLDDPLLPVELLPARWPGTALRAAYTEFRADFIALVERAITTGQTR